MRSFMDALMDSTRHIGWSRSLMQGVWLQEGCAGLPEVTWHDADECDEGPCQVSGTPWGRSAQQLK